MEWVPRHARELVEEAMADAPVVVLLGAQRVGKRTLASEVADAHGESPITLDDAATRHWANTDPTDFVASLPRPVVLEEAHLSAPLLRAIKEAVERDATPGQFLLTGSANILNAPALRDALSRRAEIITLWPLAQSEITRSRENPVDWLFEGTIPSIEGAPIGREAFVERAVRGGCPEAFGRDQKRRERWFAKHVESVIARDVLDLADVRRVDAIASLLPLIAGQAGGLFKAERLARELGISTKTAQSYTELLENVFLVRRIEAWRPSIGKREVTTPKIYVVDSGLLASLLAPAERKGATGDDLIGKLFENFVAMEIARLLDCAQTKAAQYHYRDRATGDTVEIVLESQAGQTVGLVCRAGATLRPVDHRALTNLRDNRGERFVAGVVLYTGERTVPLTDRVWALPVSALWAHTSLVDAPLPTYPAQEARAAPSAPAPSEPEVRAQPAAAPPRTSPAPPPTAPPPREPRRRPARGPLAGRRRDWLG